ncbi:nitrilase family protein [Desulfallas thermosapovorans]|uniref:Putative amidohydrolase n=1 Tax=Desulfallas thermosapovorans DSM 6562 TaxID=1121431 RepID=A0A5S4ZVX0_9FIRM|nr:nitrilase family protein [Desulfallas thermosapovorans]TYO96218.1 putative amidohydrolase [Desulfallas thermosapovorans DSM 6562]
MEQTRVALVQMNAQLAATTLNLNKMESFVKEAAGQKVDIICFPELSVQGYSRNCSGPTAESLPGPSSERIMTMARRYNLVVLAGLAEASPTGRPYITQLVAYPNGKLLKYRKTHLGNSEKPNFTPGAELPVFGHDKLNFGVQICWDLHFPEVTAILSLKGAEIVFAPHASPTIVGNRREIWLKYMTARAYDNAVYLAACNLVGNDGAGHSFCGGALVIDPKGNVIAEAFNDREEMLVADLDPVIINTIRRKESSSMRHSFFLDSRRPELYGDLLKRG